MKLKDVIAKTPPEALDVEVSCEAIVILFVSPDNEVGVATNAPDDMVADMASAILNGKKHKERFVRPN